MLFQSGSNHSFSWSCFLTDLQHRFPGYELVPYRGLYLISYLMFQEPENWKKEFMVFVNFFLEDFPNFSGLAAELDPWYNFWDEIKYKNDLPDSLYIYLALKLIGTLSITTCECERSFSSLRSIKTWDRSTMTNGRLNRLALLFIIGK